MHIYSCMEPDEDLLFVALPLQTKVISIKNSSTEVTLLKRLKAFMEYYVYIIVRFVNEEGKKSAPSEVQGPRIVKTPAGGMSSVLIQLYKHVRSKQFISCMCSLNSCMCKQTPFRQSCFALESIFNTTLLSPNSELLAWLALYMCVHV